MSFSEEAPFPTLSLTLSHRHQMCAKVHLKTSVPFPLKITSLQPLLPVTNITTPPAQPTWTLLLGPSSPGLLAPPLQEVTRTEATKTPPFLLGAAAGGLEVVGQEQGFQAWLRAEFIDWVQQWPKARSMWALCTLHSLYIYHVQSWTHGLPYTRDSGKDKISSALHVL